MLPGLPPVDIPLPLLAGCRWLDPGTRIVVQETCIIGNSALGRLHGVRGVWGVDTGHLMTLLFLSPYLASGCQKGA